MLCCWLSSWTLCQEGSRCPWRGARLQSTSENAAQQILNDGHNENYVMGKKKKQKKNPFLNHFILLWAASYTEWMLGTIYRLDALLEYSLINRSE